MERIPNGRYTKEFREEAVKMGDGRGLIGTGDIKTSIFTKVNVGTLAEGFQSGSPRKDWQGATFTHGY